MENMSPGGQIACLPHSCDEWVIGGHEEILDLISDLVDALDKLEKQEKLEKKQEQA
jgi:hypothetical protein